MQCDTGFLIYLIIKQTLMNLGRKFYHVNTFKRRVVYWARRGRQALNSMKTFGFFVEIRIFEICLKL